MHACCCCCCCSSCTPPVKFGISIEDSCTPVEDDNLNSADQSKCENTARKALEKCCSSPEKTFTMRMEAYSKIRGDRQGHFSDGLLGFPPADHQLEVVTNRRNLYESMSCTIGTGLRTATPGPRAPSPEPRYQPKAVIYENCLKCQGKRCHPPPRFTPAQMFRNVLTGQISRSQPGLKKSSQDLEVTPDEEDIFRDGSQNVVGMHGTNFATLQTEGKRSF